MNECCMMLHEKKVEDGIKFIMSHLGLDDCESSFPRDSY